MNKCPYQGECASEGYKCKTCRHNREKKDHYDPTHPYPIPWLPWDDYPREYIFRTYLGY